MKKSDREKWNEVETYFQKEFNGGDKIDIDAILFMIGVQELGKGPRRYKKDDKVNLMHIAVCRLLEPYGYYRFEGRDKDDWPHFELVNKLPELRPNEQSILIKKAIIHYFEEKQII